MNTLEAIAYVLALTPTMFTTAAECKLEAIEQIMLPINQHKRWMHEELKRLVDVVWN
jgi:hypothetical protein